MTSGTTKLVASFPNATSSWTGTLTGAGLDFDTIRPSSKVVKVKRHARSARVRYVVTASGCGRRHGRGDLQSAFRVVLPGR
jgi:hypothetical protein